MLAEQLTTTGNLSAFYEASIYYSSVLRRVKRKQFSTCLRRKREAKRQGSLSSVVTFVQDRNCTIGSVGIGRLTIRFIAAIGSRALPRLGATRVPPTREFYCFPSYDSVPSFVFTRTGDDSVSRYSFRDFRTSRINFNFVYISFACFFFVILGGGTP